jgi:hypothetical protein
MDSGNTRKKLLRPEEITGTPKFSVFSEFGTAWHATPTYAASLAA